MVEHIVLQPLNLLLAGCGAIHKRSKQPWLSNGVTIEAAPICDRVPSTFSPIKNGVMSSVSFAYKTDHSFFVPGTRAFQHGNQSQWPGRWRLAAPSGRAGVTVALGECAGGAGRTEARSAVPHGLNGLLPRRFVLMLLAS